MKERNYNNDIVSYPILSDLIPSHPILSFLNSSLCLEKSLTVYNPSDIGWPGISPGDQLETDISITTSEYFTYGTFELVDVFVDGHTWTGSAPVWKLSAFTGVTYDVDTSDIGNDALAATEGNISLPIIFIIPRQGKKLTNHNLFLK